jgi:hypothetical protein
MMEWRTSIAETQATFGALEGIGAAYCPPKFGVLRLKLKG